MNRDVSTWPLTRLFARTAHLNLIALHCLLCSRTPLRLLTYSQICGKVNDKMSQIKLVLSYNGLVLANAKLVLFFLKKTMQHLFQFPAMSTKLSVEDLLSHQVEVMDFLDSLSSFSSLPIPSLLPPRFLFPRFLLPLPRLIPYLFP